MDTVALSGLPWFELAILELVSIQGQFLRTWGRGGPGSSGDMSEGGSWPVLLPLRIGMGFRYGMGFRDGPGFAFQNSKPDSLLKMEEEQKLEKSPLSGNKDTRFSFSFSNKKLLGYVSACARRGWLYMRHMLPRIP